MRIGLDLAASLAGEPAPAPAVVELLAELMRQAGEHDEVSVFVPDDSGPLAWRVRDEKLHQVETPFGGGRSAELWRALSFPAVERLSPGKNGPRLGALDVCHSLDPPLMPSRARRRVVTVSALDGLPSAVRRSLRRADDVLVTSESLRSALLEQVAAARIAKLERLDEKVRVVHPGIHPRYSHPPKPSAIETLCTRHPFLEQPYLLGVGLHALEEPGTRCLIDAWRLARHAHPVLPQLVLAVPVAPTREQLEDFGATSGDDRNHPVVIEMPEEDLLPALYRGAQMLLHPARDHRFGRRVAEAAASGVVAVVGAGVGVLETLGEAPIEVDGIDPTEWAHAIETLHAFPAERQRRAETGRPLAQMLGWSETAARLWDVYRSSASEPAT